MQTDIAPISILRLFETSSQNRNDFIVQIVDKIQEGEADPLKVHAYIKSMEDVIDRLTNTDEKKAKNPEQAKLYKARLLEAAQGYGVKEFSAFNGKWKIAEVGIKYDYSKCNDPVLVELEENAKEAAEDLKERQKFLQTVGEKGLDIVTAEGEVVTVYPPSKSSTTAVTLSLK